MFLPRNIERSMIRKLTESFTTSPNDPVTGLPYLARAWNVYDEDDFRDDAFTPVEPYLFILASRVPPRQTRLPLAILDLADLTNAAFEIGNRRGAYQVCALNVFARNRGERADLAGFVRQVLTDYPALTLYDYTPATATVLYTTTIEGVAVRPMSIAADLGIEGALNNWAEISWEFQLRT